MNGLRRKFMIGMITWDRYYGKKEKVEEKGHIHALKNTWND